MNYPEQQPTGSSFAARCYRHPDREANVGCTRCERPICPACMREAPVGFQCPECVRTSSNSVRQPTLPYGGKLMRTAGLVTIVLGGLNIVTYIITAFTSPSGIHHNASSRLFSRMVLSPTLVAQDGAYWRFIGSAFLHYGFIHLAVNMISLAVLGPAIERVFGHGRFVVLYFVAALGGATAVYAFGDPIAATAGASAAIFGLFGALVVVYRKLGLDLRMLIPTILINVYITTRIPDISWVGHIGGFVAGAVVAAAMVYAPRVNRLAYQITGVALVILLMVGLTVWRSSQLGAF